ncbi:hypothetical protein SAMN04487911_1316 [Arenibacter nanhaiticus]|uniref:DUF3185 domain-containing protein n=1 Tax=Arenibacter nanhaiticus TaxID=558155 RepID=A0A1M6LDZ3_9FLAO|nr:hypothetical protein [Arenibacter nanhaiticus]SHJ69461.1 hypothetical protein SAMN04487911_1316 [Arenibacter nanhaiticus]
MNKTIKMILVIAGTVLLGYGIYTFIVPETVVSIGSLDLIKAQDNNNAYIAIGLGLVILFLGLYKK